VLEPLDLIGRKGDPLRPLDLEKVPEGYPRSLSGVQLLEKKRGALRQKNPKTREDLPRRFGRKDRLLDLVESRSS
jgi:hypothetical protein